MASSKATGKAAADKVSDAKGRAKTEPARANNAAEGIGRSEEARNLAREAKQEMSHGDREEGQFLAEEAKELDARAAEEVLHERGGRQARGEDHGGSRGGAHGGHDQGAGSAHGGSAVKTTDHDFIRRWIEERGGRPTVVKGTEGKDGEGILRVDFAEPDEKLEKISWEEFFDTFEDRQLAFLHQDETSSGKTSRFFKFVRR